jgi:Protein of unknown function (DUF3592)
VVAGAIVLGVLGLVLAGSGGRSLTRLHRMRKLSDVTGTVVGRDRQFTGKSFWTYPVVEFTTRDGRLIRRTFQQAARPTVGRKLRIVYDPNALPDGRTRSTRMGLALVSSPPMIYFVWLLLWLWVLTAVGLALLAGCIAIVVSG